MGTAWIAVCFVALLAVAPVAAQNTEKGATQDSTASTTPATTQDSADDNYFVGADTCQFCHPDIFDSFQKGPHFAIDRDMTRGPMGGWHGKYCEACHGMGGTHSGTGDPADIRDPAVLPPQESSEVCLTCHRNQTTQVGRLESSHARNQIACVSCHKMHRGLDELLPQSMTEINKNCGSCHISERAAFARPYTHRLEQGAMSCVDCHNPHGRNMTPTNRMLAAAGEPTCLNCHGDKRGPFIYEHAPMRTNGCTACHVPHGSANPRMLTRQDVPTVCLQCHANLGTSTNLIGGVPPAFHDLRNARFQNCTVCHLRTHGSNVDRFLLR